METATQSLPFCLTEEVQSILDACPGYTIANNVSELVDAACPDPDGGWTEVAYDVPDHGRVVEATVCRVRNGVAANYPEPYMRRRDPNCMLIGDELPTNKPRYRDRYNVAFEEVRQETFDWLKQQHLMVFAFRAGSSEKGKDAIVIAPANAGFFALGLGLLQGIVDSAHLDEDFRPQAVIYVAPVFRHTHFDGKQVVVHNRRLGLHELFSYNLYPGPSAKKGVYGMLIHQGEGEQWVTAHGSTVQVVTPYDNTVTIMHEGASGGGKSEMLEHPHRETDGRLRFGTNTVTGEERFVTIPRTCELRPVTDDMALCHPSLTRKRGKLTVTDAENAWFVRVNHIQRYGTDPHLEASTVKPTEPLLFLNIDAAPNSTALIWEHIEDEPGKRCPNPRVVVPRTAVPGAVDGPVAVDIRSFGVRTPPCTADAPSYGILGLCHVLPPAIAWLWRLVAPRGHDNPSIVGTGAMESEGVGSYWPFATGRQLDQANLLLQQFLEGNKMRYILCPNQHIGAWHVSFVPQWLTREYMARRGNARFPRNQLRPSRCPLLGYSMRTMTVEGQMIANWFLRPETQPEVGEQAYDAGAEILLNFFREQLKGYLSNDLLPEGAKIIECCLDGGTLEDYEGLIEGAPIFIEE